MHGYSNVFGKKPNFNEYYQIADIEKIRYSVKHKF